MGPPRLGTVRVLDLHQVLRSLPGQNARHSPGLDLVDPVHHEPPRDPNSGRQEASHSEDHLGIQGVPDHGDKEAGHEASCEDTVRAPDLRRPPFLDLRHQVTASTRVLPQFFAGQTALVDLNLARPLHSLIPSATGPRGALRTLALPGRERQPRAVHCLSCWRIYADRVQPQLRDDAPSNLVELAVGKCLIAEMDAGRWRELGLKTGTRDVIVGHDRLLRSLSWGDPDYDDCVYSVLPTVLGYEPAEDLWDSEPSPSLRERFPKLPVVMDYIDLPAWLALHDPGLFARLFETSANDAALPDGTVVTAAEQAAVRLEIHEMRRQIERIRRDYTTDPEAAIGQTKDLIETTCKTILGQTGDDRTKDELPALIKKTQIHLGLDPAEVAVEDPVAARAARPIMGSVAQILDGAVQHRNAKGTGHGRSGTLLVDEALARMAVGMALPTVVYLIEVWEARTGGQTQDQPAPVAATVPSSSAREAGSTLTHPTYGEGIITGVAETEHGAVATVNFGRSAGIHRVLV